MQTWYIIKSMQDVKAGVYRHYKGKYYLVLGVARHSETEDAYIVYVPLYVREGPRMAIRPFNMFFEEIVADGKKQPRFAYVGPEMSEDLA